MLSVKECFYPVEDWIAGDCECWLKAICYMSCYNQAMYASKDYAARFLVGKIITSAIKNLSDLLPLDKIEIGFENLDVTWDYDFIEANLKEIYCVSKREMKSLKKFL